MTKKLTLTKGNLLIFALILSTLIMLLAPMKTSALSGSEVRYFSGNPKCTVETGKGWGAFYVFKPCFYVIPDKNQSLSVLVVEQGTNKVVYNVTGISRKTEITLDRNKKYTVHVCANVYTVGACSGKLQNRYSCRF